MRLHPYVVSAAVALLLVLAPTAVQAQESQEQPDLPDIAPREVEIRGQLEISFPSLQRQPLIGFNPPPRLPEIPAGRVPFVEEYKQRSADLPPSPLSPPAPPRLTGLSTRTPARVEFDATVGRYFSRTIRGRVGLPVGQYENFMARLDYAGLDAYRPFEDDAPYNLFDGALTFATSRRTFNAGAEVGGFVDTYSLFGALVSGGSSPIVPLPTRDGRGLNTSGWIRASLPSGTDARLKAEFASSAYETDVFGDVVEEGPLHRSEQRIGAEGSVEFQAGAGRIGVESEIAHGTMDELTAANTGVTSYDAAAYVRFPLAGVFQLTAGARLLGFDLKAGDDTPDDALPGNEMIVMPDARLEMYLAHGAMLYVQNRPVLEHHPLPELLRINPFVVAEPILAPTLSTIDAEAGGRFFVGPVQIGVRGGYSDYASLLFFEHVDASAAEGYARGFSASRYEDATVIYGGGDLSMTIASGVQASIGVTGRHGRLEDDVIIPYFGSVVGDAMLSFVFDDSRGLVQLTGRYESSRYRDRAQTRKLGDFFDMDLLATYQVTPALKLLVALDNISADRLERFDGYPLPSFVARAGVGVRW